MNWDIINQFYNGSSFNSYEEFGAHFTVENGVEGVRFTVCAPKAFKIQVIGDFNNWYGNGYEMQRLDNRGTYSLFISNVKEGARYKYRVFQCTGRVVDKFDPYAFFGELRPDTASIVTKYNDFNFTDSKWIQNRTKALDAPLNIYELHFGSWRMKHNDSTNIVDKWYHYTEICDELIAYVKEMNFTHIELMPITEHPFDGSWGYQVSGYFSLTARYGNINELKYFINKCHNEGIGVILDFVPVHYVKDDFALARFDGSCLYEYEYKGLEYSEWGTCNFNLFRKEVRSFLFSSATYWLENFHFDGLRMDAIANALYWQGNSDRGVNVAGVDLLKTLNAGLNERFREILIIAEDSTAFPKVTDPVEMGGLGFDYKWDMGWMNDTLKYFSINPIDRHYEHNKINFSMYYFGSEHFMMPFSHDEVVHGKHTIIDKLWGSYEDKFAQCRSLYAYMYTHPGKKINFMGNELAMFREWDESKELDWKILEFEKHEKFHRFFRDLSNMYVSYPSLNKGDFTEEGFKWIDADDSKHGVFSYIRTYEDESLVIVMNTLDKYYEDYALGYFEEGEMVEILNTENDIYGGCNILNDGVLKTTQFEDYKERKKNIKNPKEKVFPYYFNIKLPRYGTCIFKIKK